MEAAIATSRPQNCDFHESMSHKNKRKRKGADVIEEVRSKVHCSDQLGTENNEASPWKNLELISSLQDKNISLLKKVDLAFDYVKSSSIIEIDDIARCPQVMDTSRTIVFLNNWVQSVLISSAKKARQEENEPDIVISGTFLDHRCWSILHYSLEESKNLHMPLAFPKDFLRVVHSIATDVSHCIKTTLSDERMQFYDTVVDCISLVFSFHGGVANENLDLWIMVMDKVLELNLKIITVQIDESKLRNFVARLSCYLFEPFAKYLRAHPTRKTGFQIFIDKLLEPLLHLLHVLRFRSCAGKSERGTNLSKLVEEVLAQGLFHPTHIDGFLVLQSTDRYRNYSDETVRDEKLFLKSYHRHFFDKVEKIVEKKNGSALIGLGELLQLFVSSVTKHKGALVSEGSSKKITVSRSMNAELRKSSFDYFIQILEYLLADLDKNLQPDGEISISVDVSSTLRSINSLLASCICDNLYLRTEDTSEGASGNFLRSTYAMLMSFSAKITRQETSFFGSDENSYRELLVSVRKEIIVAVHHLLNIEYDVVGDDLESLWTMVFSSVGCCYRSMDVVGQPFLLSEIVSLSCRLIDLYSELRQVDSSIFALCRAVRYSFSHDEDREAYNTSSSCSFCSSSLSMLFCSLEFRLSLSNAIKAIPEGQASACIRQLSSDIKESLEWIKSEHQFPDLDQTEKSNPPSCDSLQLRFQAELAGKVLCEAYIIILDSITITSGNSYLVGVSLKNLIEIIRPSLSSSLVSRQPDSNKSSGCDNETMCWVLEVLFRLVLSSRSLFRQAISVMPPSASKKMSVVINDLFTTHSGRDWLNMTGCADKGFFSWIFQPSVTLLEVIQSVSDICIQDSVVLCPQLVYVLNVMALQRLVDLNKLIKSSEYMLQWDQNCSPSNEDADCCKRIKKWTKCVTKMRKEAEGLTKCMMGFFSSIAEDQIFALSHVSGIDDALNFSLGSLDEKSLPSALWCIICQNVDIWCSHADKKGLKNFLMLLIRVSLHSINDHDDHFRMHKMSKPRNLNKVTAHQIALEFLSNTISFEQKFVRRYMASCFCRILQKSVSSIFDASGVDLSETPDWAEVISAFEKFSDVQMTSDESYDNHINSEFTTCQRLLSLLMRMPEEYFNLKSSSLYITYILNLERLLVGSLLGWSSATCSLNPYQIFQLFVTCRRALQTLAVASSKENLDMSRSFSLPWLLKSLSAVIGSQHSFPEDIVVEAKVDTFSLMDHTSNLLQIVSTGQFEHSISSIVSAGKLDGERQTLDNCQIQLNPKEGEWQSVLQISEAFKEHLQKDLTTFRDSSTNMKVECLAGFQDLNNLSSTVACFQGLLWGLASTLADTNAVNSNSKTKFSRHNPEMMAIVRSCVDTCLNFTTFFMIALFLEDDPTLYMSASGKIVLSDKKSEGTEGNLKKISCSSIPDLEVFLTDVKKWKLRPKKCLLMQVFRGENPEAAFFLRQLFITCSAILRLNLQIDLNISWTLFSIALDISQFLLTEFTRSEMPNQFAYFWLDGVVKFIEELGSYFPLFDPLLSRDFYVDLIGLHLRVIGKCIALQGKEAKLASQETGSRANKLANHDQLRSSWGASRLSQLKEKLRTSFITYIKKSSEFHLLSSIQAVERALVGVQEGLMTNYEIVCGVSDGAEVSSVVAAGIDMLDLILEFVTGPKRLNMVKRHIQSLVACLFNIILHLQDRFIFNGYADTIKAHGRPDSGSVILMCIEVLTKISGKPSFFQIDACHIAQSLRVPGALFQYLLQHQISEATIEAAPETSTSNSAVDGKFSVELYVACCRMLCNSLKHHKSETWLCIALFEDSVSVLLHCLEVVNNNGVSGGDLFAWKVKEAVKCASSLRRVYEEVRQQKDVFGRCSFQFLSRYISVYCGFGPTKNGIIREVDEALKPGVYALIDTCSDDDLQLLHTVFGEGPCRTTLAALQHDYKVNFQFEGKV